MRAHTAGYVDTHHKSGAVRPGSQTDKADTGRSLSADKSSPATFFLCLALFISPMEFYQGAAVAEFAHPGFGRDVPRPRPHGVHSHMRNGVFDEMPHHPQA